MRPLRGCLPLHFLMESLEILGYLGAMCIGLVLGLIGGGGTILCVPILVFLFGVKPTEATAYSLFIVGATAAVGSIRAYILDMVDLRIGVLFGIPSIFAVFVTRYWLFPAIPESIGPDSLIITKDTGVMVLFAVLMLAASITMIKGRKKVVPDSGKRSPILIMGEGLVVGLLTGLVGAGGGFLIIPALVVLGKLEMKMAVGTSLLIIAMKSLLGFTGDVLTNDHIEWPFLLVITLLAIVGIFLGLKLSDRLPNKLLKKSFGWFVLLFGIFILYRELISP